ncbi:sensor domain-containing diguanylate cyclase [Shewanella aestuarii]|uniref:Diguanylate cyclase n=1 Tax=Shewanella aestuarii TaxID=1028752 RepID=A0A6G9QN64_9GAMM|nr:sensor domain-containing diguanylate cyclase [Shewanella aestuarii]QIR15497.1 diguanylate cyclase [Shewanella aestuarii]
MSIKFKLAIPPLLGLMLVIAFIQVFWQPQQLASAKIKYENHINELLDITAVVMVPHILEKDLGSLFSTLEMLEKNYANHWYNITFFNQNNRKIYPLFRNDTDTAKLNSEFIQINYPIKLTGEPLGFIVFEADWGKEKTLILKNISAIQNVIIYMIILIIAISTLSQFQLIYRPLKKLSRAANKIENGDFNTELPRLTKDELGELTKSFSAMQQELAFKNKTLDHHAIISMTDIDGVITYVNDNFIKISGYTEKEIIGSTHNLVSSNRYSPEFYQNMWQSLKQGDVWHGEICNLTKSGVEYWVNSTIVPFLNNQGKPERYLSIKTDITKQKLAQEKLKHLANHDALTSLPTRRLCLENLTKALSMAKRDNSIVGIMFIDLDGFKAVNDTLGHDAGDLLLIGVSERLLKCTREMDTVARVGGDEFIIILSRAYHRDNVEAVATKIIDTLTEPFNLNEQTAQIGASIGIALYPNNGHGAEELIKCADEMMYAVKRKGKNNFSFFDDI